MRQKLSEKREQLAVTAADAERRLARMRSASRLKDGEWPGQPGLKFKMKALSRTDVDECHAAAYAYLKVDLKLDPTEPMNMPLFDDNLRTEILFRALRDPDDPSITLASNVRDLRDSMTVDEQVELLQMFIDFESELDPAPEVLGPVLVKAMEDAVKKKDEATLKGFGGRKLCAYLLSLAGPPTSSTTGSSAAPDSSTESTPS